MSALESLLKEPPSAIINQESEHLLNMRENTSIPRIWEFILNKMHP